MVWSLSNHVSCVNSFLCVTSGLVAGSFQYCVKCKDYCTLLMQNIILSLEGALGYRKGISVELENRGAKEGFSEPAKTCPMHRLRKDNTSFKTYWISLSHTAFLCYRDAHWLEAVMKRALEHGRWGKTRTGLCDLRCYVCGWREKHPTS